MRRVQKFVASAAAAAILGGGFGAATTTVGNHYVAPAPPPVASSVCSTFEHNSALIEETKEVPLVVEEAYGLLPAASGDLPPVERLGSSVMCPNDSAVIVETLDEMKAQGDLPAGVPVPSG